MEVGSRDLLVSFSVLCCCLFLIVESIGETTTSIPGSDNKEELNSFPPFHLHILDNHVVMDNGIASVTLSTPKGFITDIRYNGINLLEYNKEANRGYWDVVWSTPNSRNMFDELETTSYRIIQEDENQIELSFLKTWNEVINGTDLPLNIDKRFIMLRGRPGFYTYAIYEHLEGWPDLNIAQSRVAFKLQHRLFDYMALSDKRQRVMPTEQDRIKGQSLAYGEAVLLTNPDNSDFKGEVDDKYQYSSDIKDNQVHGWICSNPPTGFWVITPSDEFRVGGPLKQELTSHVGPTSLAMLFSGHYTGETGVILRNGEPWKKVFGPFYIYLNSASADHEDPVDLWKDAKEQMLIETKSWPYNFPQSEDYPHADQRGTVSGQFLVRDRYINKELMAGKFAHIGLAPHGDAGSWQRETKGYQFWTQADANGYFLIKGVRPGSYSLYAWVPGILGDFKYDVNVIVTPGQEIKMDFLVFDPPRRGPTLWEIGVPDRTAAEFYVPDPNPTLMNNLYVNHTDKFRQYGLWERYTDLYPDQDLIYTVGVSNYTTDWFYAHLNRDVGNGTYWPAMWQIVFDLPYVNYRGLYTLQLALASANGAELQVRVNNPNRRRPNFSTGLIGKDNAIARHGIHGLYWFYSVQIPAFNFQHGRNTIFLRQSRSHGPFIGLMYDYLRLEGPPEN